MLAGDLTGSTPLHEIAGACGLSVSHFSRVFHKSTGLAPHAWLLRARVRRAQYLLEHTDQAVERISATAGFGSATAFRERFKRVTGTTPHAYRAAFRSSR